MIASRSVRVIFFPFFLFGLVNDSRWMVTFTVDLVYTGVYGSEDRTLLGWRATLVCV